MKTVCYFPIITDQDRAMPFYITTIGISRNELKVYRSNGFEDYQLLYCSKGEGYVVIHGEEKKITPGMAMSLR